LNAQAFDALFIPDSGRKLALIAPALATGGLFCVLPGTSMPRGGRAITVIAPTVATDVLATRGSSHYLQGALFSVPFHAPSAQGAGQLFVDAYTQRFGEAPDPYAAYAYDAFRLARRAVESGQTTRAGVAGWLGGAGRQETAGASGGIGRARGPAIGSRILELRGDAFVDAAGTRPAS
jgi:hypothetical protein